MDPRRPGWSTDLEHFPFDLTESASPSGQGSLAGKQKPNRIPDGKEIQMSPGDADGLV
jgi:hypothetical protein